MTCGPSACRSPLRAGRDHETLKDFAADLSTHGGDPEHIEHACIDMSAAYALGITESLPKVQISYDRFHVVALANEAMDEMRRQEMCDSAQAVAQAAGLDDKDTRKQLL
jgi:transposase